jgi:hypothetical protein
VPLLQGRVAPRCTNADSLLLVDILPDGSAAGRVVGLPVATPEELLGIAHEYRVTTFVCDGITPDSRIVLLAHGLRIVDNVVGSAEEVMNSLTAGALRHSFGLRPRGSTRPRRERLAKWPRARARRRRMPQVLVRCRPAP